MKRHRRNQRGISSIVGTLFFILIVLIALSVLMLIFNSFTGYANLVKQTNQQDLQNKETSLSISSFSFGTPTAITVGTSNTGSATAYSFERKLLYSQGLWWLFYSNGSDIVYRTSSDGMNWSVSSVLVSVAPGSDSGFSFSLWLQGSTLYYVLATDSTQNGQQGFDWGSGTLNSFGYIFATVHTVSTTNQLTSNYDSITVDSSGNVWVAINTNNSGTHALEVWERKSGTWYQENFINQVPADTSPVLLPLTSGIALIYGTGASTGTVSITTTTNGASWSPQISPPSNYAFFDSSAIFVGNTIYFVGLASSSAGATSGSLDFWSYSFGAASTSIETALVPEVNSWMASISQVNGTFIVFYGEGNDVYQVVSMDQGGSWGPAQLLSNSESSIAGLTSAQYSPGVIWTSATGSPFTVRFLSPSTVVVSSTTPFAVHLISLYLYSPSMNTLVHFDTNASASGVAGRFDYWIGQGQALTIPIFFNFASGQAYLITLTTDTGLIFTASATSPT